MMLAARRAKPRMRKGRLMVVAVADEEAAGHRGTGFLFNAGAFREVDFAVVGEQTANLVALAHKGTVRATVITYGHSVHATDPDRGLNAIHGMADVVAAVERYHRSLHARSHRLLGTATASVNVIRGGTAGNVVAGRCEIIIDRRTIPPERDEEIAEELRQLLGQVAKTRPGFRGGISDISFMPWFEAPGQDHYSARFMENVRSISGRAPGPVGYMPGSDAKFFQSVLAATPTVVFGPGSYEQAHSANEWVPVRDLIECTRILEEFAGDVLGGN